MRSTLAGTTPFLLSFVAPLTPSLLAQQLLSTIASPNPCGNYAYSIDGGADIDGDGYDDLVIGEPPCSIRVVSGKNNSELLKILSLDPATMFGAKVAIVGDTNGDGSLDLAIGATMNPNLPVSAPGRVFLISTQTSLPLHTETSSDWWFGRAVDSAGDFNADGFSDVVIGSPINASGQVRVHSGSTWMPLITESGVTFGATDGIGRYVTAVGDVDGNGSDEIAASGPWGWIVRGSTAFSISGSLRTLAGRGDITGDGVPDLALGNIADPGSIEVWSGATWTLFGSASFPSSNPFFGGVLSIPGDVSGDGRADVVVGYGDPWSGPFLPALGTPGKIYLVSFSSGHSAAGSLLTGPPGFGAAISRAGDVNGNGSPEFAVKVGGAVEIYTSSCGSIQTYQDGVSPCLGLGGIEPRLEGHGCATPGGIAYIDITKAPGGSIALIFFGTQQTLQPMGYGCALKIWPVSPAILGPLPLMPIGATGPGIGFFSIAGKLPLPLPPIDITMQAFIPDSSVPGGFTTTNGLQMSVH